MFGDAFENVVTKHEQIIRYIKALEVNTKVSVRQIAKEMDVSEGTAYRAIKEAENRRLVCSVPKVGTIRIEPEEERVIEDFTLNEIIKIVEGEVLTSGDNLQIPPLCLVIGSYSRETLKQFLVKGALLIVGDKPDLQQLAIEADCHLMVTGALKVPAEIRQQAEEKNLTIISCPFETFEAVSLLNRAVYDRITEKELVHVDDIMVKEVFCLSAEATVADWHALAQKTGHSRFPVVDQNKMVVGIVTAVDVAGMERETSVLSVMTKDVLMVEPQTLLAHLSRLLVWEGVELVPIIKERKLVGVISRQDILKALQQTQKQPHVGETVDNLVMSGFKLEDWAEGTKLSGEITQFMINEFGAASPGTLVIIISTASYIVARKQHRLNTVVENLSLQHVHPLAVGDRVEVYAKIIHLEKKSCLAEVEINCQGNLKAKALVGSRIVKK